MNILSIELYTAMKLDIYDPQHAPQLIYNLALHYHIPITHVVDTSLVMKLSKGHQSPGIGSVAIITTQEDDNVRSPKFTSIITSDPVDLALIISKCPRQI